MERSKNTNVFQRNKHKFIILLLATAVSATMASTAWGGGAVGSNSGTIENGYSTGSVFASFGFAIGGLVGVNGNGGTIENSYSIGSVFGSATDIGGLIGVNYGTVTNSFYNSQTGGRTDNDGRGVPLTTTQMRRQSYFTNWNFTTIWGINANINDGMPHLRMFYGECPHTWSGWITTSAPTCETDGVATRNCTDCGEAEIQPIAKLGHDWSGDWMIKTQATCINNRVEEKNCARDGCNHTDEQAVPETALGHNWDNWGNWTTTTAPTCDGDGIRIRIAECRRMSCETDTTQIGTIPQLTDCPTSIRGRQEAISPYRILLENAVVSDFARISVITPEQATVNLAIFDNLGNVVFSTVETRHALSCNTEFTWNLTNQSGRFVANGTYLIIVEAVGISGRRFTYSARIGVSR